MRRGSGSITPLLPHSITPPRACRSPGNVYPIDPRAQEIQRFVEEILRSPTEAHARQVLERARGIKRPIEFLSGVAHRCRELGRLDASLLVWMKVRELNPNYAPAREHLVRTLLMSQRPADAELEIAQWIESDPDAPIAWGLLGFMNNTLQRWGPALEAFQRSFELGPEPPELLTAYANTLWKLDRRDEAMAVLNRALELNPANASALNDIGVMELQTGRHEIAVRAFEAALKLAPETPTIRHNMSMVLRSAGRHQEALVHAEHAVRLTKGSSAAAANLASILNEVDRFGDAANAMAKVNPRESAITIRAHISTLRGLKQHVRAIDELKDWLTTEPESVDLWFILGNMLMEQGRGEEAEAAYDKALELNPRAGAHHRAKADLHTYREGDAHLAAMEELAKAEDLPPFDRMHLDYALGKAYDEVRDYERAFGHLRQANTVKRASSVYDEPGVGRLVELVKKLLPEPFEPIDTDGSSLPVFVVGMPRSGTTLVEQILSRHPLTKGLGEPTYFHQALDKVIFFSPAGIEYPIADERYRELGEMYMQFVVPEAGEAQRTIDKLPSNFFFLGFIAKSMPNARIIHVRRDPVDTCISLYSKLFTKTQTFSYDLGELGRYYRKYLEITAHWRRVLPAGSMLEIEYEALVRSPEETVREMLSFIGLEWDEAMMRAPEKPSVVMTASAVQVRRPIYKTSVGRRDGYLPYLGELVEALEGESRD